MTPLTPEIIVMKAKEFFLNDHRVIVVDAPVNATHSSQIFHDGANFLVYRKRNVIAIYCFDQSDSDSTLTEEYVGRIINVGALSTAPEGVIADLFNTVKRGNFYDYEHNGVFYPSAVSALKDILEQENVKYLNPYVMIVKPF